MRHTALVFVVGAATLAASLRGDSPRLESVDPLTLPAPVMEEELVLPLDTRAAHEKIGSGLWQKATELGAGDTLRVVVTLHEPLAPGVTSLGEDDQERRRVEHVAAAEHTFAARASALGGRRLSGLSHLPIVFLDAPPSLLSQIAAIPGVKALEYDAPIQAFRTEGAALIKADQLRTSFGGTGTGKAVAIIDSGIDCAHPELSSRIAAQGDYTGTTGTGCADGNGHGTAVAGIVAGTSGGMAPQAKVWAMKVLKNDGTGTTQMTLDALNATYANRANFGGIHVVNMSLGATGSKYNSDCDAANTAYATAVNQLVSVGIPVFAASGNDGFLDGISVPACLSNVISVGAVTDQAFNPDPLCGGNVSADSITCYSNSGTPLDILAPSHCARTPAPNGTYNACFNGTSAASPYAAGVAAQLLSLRAGTTPAQLRNALMTTGRTITDVNGIARNRIDAVAAYNALSGGGTSPCVRSAQTACLLNGRFEVKVQWTTSTGTGAAQVMSFGAERTESNESVFYYFFNPANFEMGVKVLDGCGLGGNFWIFLSGLTNQGYTVTVRDTLTGRVKTYSNPLGTYPTTVGDTSALPCN